MKPTFRQELFVDKIALLLEIPKPEEYTKGAYWKFIHDNKSAYEEKYRSTHCAMEWSVPINDDDGYMDYYSGLDNQW